MEQEQIWVCNSGCIWIVASALWSRKKGITIASENQKVLEELKKHFKDMYKSSLLIIATLYYSFFMKNTFKNPIIIFVAKYTISTAVIIVNPVSSPNVPPIAESILTNVAAFSLVTRSNVGVTNCILINLKSCLFSYSENIFFYKSVALVSRLFCLSGKNNLRLEN